MTQIRPFIRLDFLRSGSAARRSVTPVRSTLQHCNLPLPTSNETRKRGGRKQILKRDVSWIGADEWDGCSRYARPIRYSSQGPKKGISGGRKHTDKEGEENDYTTYCGKQTNIGEPHLVLPAYAPYVATRTSLLGYKQFFENKPKYDRSSYVKNKRRGH